MKIVSDNIIGGMREMRFKHLDNNIRFAPDGKSAIMRYKSINIELDLNTKIYRDIGSGLIDYKRLIIIELGSYLGWESGLMDSNDRFFM